VFHAYFSPRVPDHGERVETRSLGAPGTDGDDAQGIRGEERLRARRLLRQERVGHHYYYYTSAAASRRAGKSTDRLRALDYYWDGEPTLDLAAPHEAASAAHAVDFLCLYGLRPGA
jgi:hypothetical protein